MTNARRKFSKRRSPNATSRKRVAAFAAPSASPSEIPGNGMQSAAARQGCWEMKEKQLALHMIIVLLSDGDRLALSKSAEDCRGCATIGENVRLKSQKQKESCPQR